MTISLSNISIGAGGWSPIGVDFGQRSVKAAQCRRVRGGWKLMRAVSIPRAERTALPTPAECARLAGVLYRRGFEGTEVVLAAPASAVLTSIMDLPPRGSGAPVDTIARMELARAHKRDAAALEVAWWELPDPARPGGTRASDGVAAMAVGMTHEHAGALLDAMKAAGLNVAAIEPLPMALARAALPLCAGSSGLSAIVDVGWSAATVSLIHGTTLIYTRAVEEAGLKKFYERALPRMGLDEARLDRLLAESENIKTSERRGVDREVHTQLEAHAAILSRELKASLTYAGHRYPGIARGSLLLVGGGAELAGLAQHVGAAIEATATPVAPAMLAAECDAALVMRGAGGLCGATALTTHPGDRAGSRVERAVPQATGRAA